MSFLDLQRTRDAQILDVVSQYPMLNIDLVRVLMRGMSYRVATRRLHALAEHGDLYRYSDPMLHLLGYSTVKYGKAEKPQIAHRLMASRFWVCADFTGLGLTDRLFDHEMRSWLTEAKCPLVPDGFARLGEESYFFEFSRYGQLSRDHRVMAVRF